MANGHHKQMRDLQLVDALQNGMDVSVSGTVVDGDFTADRVVIHQYPKMLEPALSSPSRRPRTRCSSCPCSSRRLRRPPLPVEPFTVAALDSAVFGVAPIQASRSITRKCRMASSRSPASPPSKARHGSTQRMPPPDSKGNAVRHRFHPAPGQRRGVGRGVHQANTTPELHDAGEHRPRESRRIRVQQPDSLAAGPGSAISATGSRSPTNRPSLPRDRARARSHLRPLSCWQPRLRRGADRRIVLRHRVWRPVRRDGQLSPMHFNAFQKQL